MSWVVFSDGAMLASTTFPGSLYAAARSSRAWLPFAAFFESTKAFFFNSRSLRRSSLRASGSGISALRSPRRLLIAFLNSVIRAIEPRIQLSSNWSASAVAPSPSRHSARALSRHQYPCVCFSLPKRRLFVFSLPLPPRHTISTPRLLIKLPIHLISAPFRSLHPFS